MKPGPYSILLTKYRDGRHRLNFTLDDDFFRQYDPEASTGNHLTVVVNMQKSERLVDLKLHFKGSMTTPCDRCTEPYAQPIDAQRRLVFTPDYGDESWNNVDELLPLDPQNPVIHLQQELYDFACLALPHRRVPPHCPSDACPEPVLAYLNEATPAQQEQTADWARIEGSKPGTGGGSAADKPTEAQKEPGRIDPRWEKLRALLGEEKPHEN